jgi:hypothetical protein
MPFNLKTTVEVVWISVAILFVLFFVQRFGTDKVGYSFAPVISVWFVLIAGTGMYNLAVHDVTVRRAFNPVYIIQYFTRNGKEAWVSLGGVILCITGTSSDSPTVCFEHLFDLSNSMSIRGIRRRGHVCGPWPFQHQGHSGTSEQ